MQQNYIFQNLVSRLTNQSSFLDPTKEITQTPLELMLESENKTYKRWPYPWLWLLLLFTIIEKNLLSHRLLFHLEEMPSEGHACVRVELSDWWMAGILYLMAQVPPASKMNLFKICKAAITGASPSSLSARAVQSNDARYMYLLRWLVPQLRQRCRNRTFTSPALLATGLTPWSPIHLHFHLLSVTLLALISQLLQNSTGEERGVIIYWSLQTPQI